MIYDPPERDAAGDFNHNFQRTHAYVNKLPVYIDQALPPERIADKKGRIAVYQVSKKCMIGGAWKPNQEFIPMERMEITLPESGLYQYGTQVAYFHREINRQFKKGLCQNNSLLVNAVNGGLIPVQAKELIPIFEPVPLLSFDEAFKKANGYMDAWVFSRELAVHNNVNIPDKKVLFYLNNKVGFLTAKKKCLLLGEWEYLRLKLEDYMEIEEII